MRNFFIIFFMSIWCGAQAQTPPYDYKTLHFQSERIKADSIRVRCIIEVPDIDGISHYTPVKLQSAIRYKNGKEKSYLRNKVISSGLIRYPELLKFLPVVYHSMLKYAEGKDYMAGNSYNVPFYIHRKAPEKEDDKFRPDFIPFKRAHRSDSLTIYRSSQGEFRMKLYDNGQFEYTRASIGITYGGSWSREGDTLKLSSKYFESNPMDCWNERFAFIYKYTDEHYCDRFVMKDGMLYPIMSHYSKEPFLPFNTFLDYRRYKKHPKSRGHYEIFSISLPHINN